MPPIKFCGADRLETLPTHGLHSYVYSFNGDLPYLTFKDVHTCIRVTHCPDVECSTWDVSYGGTHITVNSEDELRFAMFTLRDAMVDTFWSIAKTLSKNLARTESVTRKLQDADDSAYVADKPVHTLTLQLKWTGDISPETAEDCIISYVEGEHPGAPTHGPFTVTEVNVVEQHHHIDDDETIDYMHNR